MTRIAHETTNTPCPIIALEVVKLYKPPTLEKAFNFILQNSLRTQLEQTTLLLLFCELLGKSNQGKFCFAISK